MSGLPVSRILSAALIGTGAALPLSGLAQSKAVVEQERRDFADWLRTAAVSPLRAVVLRPVGSAGVSIGPASADIPLAGVEAGRIAEKDGRVTLAQGKAVLGLARGRAQLLRTWRLVVSGPPGRGVVTVFGPTAPVHKEPSHFPYDPARAYVVTLVPSADAREQRLLAPDGVEVEAGEAGTVSVATGAATISLRVMRLPGATEDESELEIYFRDGTSGKGTYPAGRFVSLIPRPDGRFLLDFNRARNPFCAYNTVYPCPAPWRGNAVPDAISAGERYADSGLGKPSP